MLLGSVVLDVVGNTDWVALLALHKLDDVVIGDTIWVALLRLDRLDDVMIGDTDWVALLGLDKLDDVMVIAGIVCCWLCVLVCFAIAVGFFLILCMSLHCLYFNAVFFDQKIRRCPFPWWRLFFLFPIAEISFDSSHRIKI